MCLTTQEAIMIVRWLHQYMLIPIETTHCRCVVAGDSDCTNGITLG